MSDLASIFDGLVRHSIATLATPDTDAQPGIEWRIAANGVFKRGRSATVALQGWLCPLGADVPGLRRLLPYVRWASWPGRLPGALLAPLLADAQRACVGTTILRPIEKQYFFVERAGPRVVAPRGQEASAVRVRYPMPASGTVLLDVHSHHGMRAYFSTADDADDQALGVSAVIGNIFQRPEIVVRLNIYGHHCPIPAGMVFDSLGPFIDRYAGGSRDADLDD